MSKYTFNGLPLGLIADPREIYVTFVQGLGWFKHILFIEYTHKDICIQQKGCDKAMIQCGQVLGYSQSKYCHAVFCFLSY